MILPLIYAFIGGSAALLLIGILGVTKAGTKRVSLPFEENQQNQRGIQLFISNIFPFSQKILEKFKLDVKIKRKLEAAHLRLKPQAFFNLKILLMVFLSILVFFASGKADPLALSLPLIFGYLLPDIWLTVKIAKRREAVVFMLPEIVDLIGLCVEAGLDFTAALKWIVEKTPYNTMVEELTFLLEEVKWGKTRTQALKDMAKRLNITELNSFVQTLVQAERMGTPVAEAFRVISEDTRQLRFQRGERLALKAPIKILIPLIFFILPVIAIVVGGPLLLQFLQGNVVGGMGP